MNSKIYNRLTAGLAFVAVASAIVFDLIKDGQLLVGSVGVVAGLLSACCYIYQHTGTRKSDGVTRETERKQQSEPEWSDRPFKVTENLFNLEFRESNLSLRKDIHSPFVVFEDKVQEQWAALIKLSRALESSSKFVPTVIVDPAKGLPAGLAEDLSLSRTSQDRVVKWGEAYRITEPAHYTVFITKNGQGEVEIRSGPKEQVQVTEHKERKRESSRSKADFALLH